MAKREARVVSRFPRIGRILLKMFEPGHTTKAFVTGADGEQEVAALLKAKLGQEALFLYNRRRGLGRERGDIDMLVVAPSGVYLVDPKKYVGRKVRNSRSRDMFIVDGRKRPHLAESMRRQVDVVTAAMQTSPVPGVPVTAAYCFLGADLPWGTLRVDGVAALGKAVCRQDAPADRTLGCRATSSYPRVSARTISAGLTESLGSGRLRVGRASLDL